MLQVRKLPEEDREYMRPDKINRLSPAERREEVRGPRSPPLCMLTAMLCAAATVPEWPLMTLAEQLLLSKTLTCLIHSMELADVLCGV